MCTLAPPQRLLPGVGASDLTVQLNLSGVGGSAAGPSQVQVKYLQASSVSQKGNFTWANQVVLKKIQLQFFSYYYFRLLINFSSLLQTFLLQTAV